MAKLTEPQRTVLRRLAKDDKLRQSRAFGNRWRWLKAPYLGPRRQTLDALKARGFVVIKVGERLGWGPVLFMADITDAGRAALA